MQKLSKQKKESYKADTGNDRLAAAISSTLLNIQHGFARFMAKRTAMIPAYMLRWVMVIVSMGCIILSAYYICRSFAGEKQDHTIHISHLRHSPHANSRIKDQKNTAIVITDEEYNEMIQFQNYMDSLGKYDHLVYESMLSARPGLMDSVLRLKQMYHQQKK